MRNKTHFVSYLGEILILTENDGNIVFPSNCHTNHIESKPNIHSLFGGAQERVSLSIGESYRLVPIFQGTTIDMHTLATHPKEFVRPKIAPLRVILGIRNPRVKPYSNRLPALIPADYLRKCFHVIVGIHGAESRLRTIKKVLSIHEYGRSFDSRLSRAHCLCSKRKPQPGPKAIGWGLDWLLTAITVYTMQQSIARRFNGLPRRVQ